MRTQVTSIEELKRIFLSIMLSKTNSVTKVAPAGVVNGVAYGCSEIGRRILKDTAILESKLFPEYAFGDELDYIAQLWGIAPRFGTQPSSTYIRLVGAVGTTYVAGTQVFSTNQNTQFDLVSNYVIPSVGFGYAKIQCRSTGSVGNVDSQTINMVSPVPAGHTYCVNEYAAFGGVDIESDDDFRKRILDGFNILSRTTIAMIEQIFMKINSNVFRVYYQGVDSNGNTVLQVLTQSGVDLTTQEIDDLLNKSQEFFSLVEFKPNGFNGYGVTIINVSWYPINISARVQLANNVDPDAVRKEAQIRCNKYINYKYWGLGETVQFGPLLDIIQNTTGIKYVYDNYFSPYMDVLIPAYSLPRIQGFLLLDNNGNVISGVSGSLNPIFYPSPADFPYQYTVLATI